MKPCPRCKGSDVYLREIRGPEGLVLEDWHTCGWSKPRLVHLVGMEAPSAPATAGDLRTDGYHREQRVAAGRKGGLATQKRHGKVGVALQKPPRKPYARRNPRKIREAMGYLHTGALDTFMPMSQAFVDPTS